MALQGQFMTFLKSECTVFCTRITRSGRTLSVISRKKPWYPSFRVQKEDFGK